MSDFSKNSGRIGQSQKGVTGDTRMKQDQAYTFDNVGQFMVTPEDLPVCCPLPSQALWDAHPRVYLPIEETGKATCPYCGAKFILTERDS